MTTTTLIKGEKYDTDAIELLGWKNGDDDTDSTYSVWDYFDADGTYKGADQSGVEPIVDVRLDLDLDIDANDETHGSVSGTQVSLYLIPAEETRNGVAEVTIFANVGPGAPEPAWHRRWHCLGSLSVDFAAESLVEVLESQRDTLEQIAASYLGSEWTGSNHVGRWGEYVDDIEIDLDCETYWSASDWLGGDWPSVEREILSAESLESMAEDIIHDADGTARLILDDVLEYLIDRAKDLLTEKQWDRDNDDTDDTDEDIAKLEALLK